jgi:hypothetical protein
LLKWFIVFSARDRADRLGESTVAQDRARTSCPVTFAFVRNGREYNFPFASSLLLSALLTWLVYALR